MVYTTLLEPYRFPKIVPVEVTVLRGARRLRFSSALRRNYTDFAPKIWHIMAKLGYSKYLQKIYVSIEFEAALVSANYQLPLVVAILEAVGMIRPKYNIHLVGRFLADYSIIVPSTGTSSGQHSQNGLYTIALKTGDQLAQCLNLLHTAVVPFSQLEIELADLFPGVTFSNNNLDFQRTPTTVIKKLPTESLINRPIVVDLRSRPLDEKKLIVLQSLALKYPLEIKSSACFCGQSRCTCTPREKRLHTEQLTLLAQLGSGPRLQ